MNALEIQSGAELLAFPLLSQNRYLILTGWETQPGHCWFCGGLLSGRQRHYCKGHYQEYRNHFEWASASKWALKRSNRRCANCGRGSDSFYHDDRFDRASPMRVHHIVPIGGAKRFYSPFNLPWNLIVLCHDCHMDVHAAMREPKINPTPLFQIPTDTRQYVLL